MGERRGKLTVEAAVLDVGGVVAIPVAKPVVRGRVTVAVVQQESIVVDTVEEVDHFVDGQLHRARTVRPHLSHADTHVLGGGLERGRAGTRETGPSPATKNTGAEGGRRRTSPLPSSSRREYRASSCVKESCCRCSVMTPLCRLAPRSAWDTATESSAAAAVAAVARTMAMLTCHMVVIPRTGRPRRSAPSRFAAPWLASPALVALNVCGVARDDRWRWRSAWWKIQME